MTRWAGLRERMRLRRQLSTTARVVIVVLAVAVGYLMVSNVTTQRDANVATSEKVQAEDDAAEAEQQAKELGDPLAALCAQDAEVRKRIGSLCDKAAAVKAEPAPEAGRNGEDGRGIATTNIANGRLLITYTDGRVEDKGPIVGAVGAAGQDGRGIVGSTINQDGSLVLSYSDGTTQTVGRVVGSDGVNGADGRGVASVSVSADYRLTITYTDGITEDAGPLPAGPPGRGIASVAFDFDSCTATVTYTDGATEQAPMTGCPESQESGGGLLGGG